MEGFFKFAERGTNVRTELLAGLTTFLTMAYIIFVNPGILSAAGVPQEDRLMITADITAGAGVVSTIDQSPRMRRLRAAAPACARAGCSW